MSSVSQLFRGGGSGQNFVIFTTFYFLFSYMLWIIQIWGPDKGCENSQSFFLFRMNPSLRYEDQIQPIVISNFSAKKVQFCFITLLLKLAKYNNTTYQHTTILTHQTCDYLYWTFAKFINISFWDTMEDF